MRPADLLFLAIEVGSWLTIGVAIFKRDRWSRLDAYWLWVGSPASIVASATDGLWLYAAAWAIWVLALFIKRARRQRGGPAEACQGCELSDHDRFPCMKQGGGV